MKKTINTIDGEKIFIKEITDKELDNEDYSIKNGYWVTHYNNKHQIYL